MKCFRVPFLRIMPIWRFGSVYSKFDGTYLSENWYPDRFGDWVFGTEEDAREFLAAKGLA